MAKNIADLGMLIREQWILNEYSKYKAELKLFNMDNSIFGIAFALGLSFFLLYTRRKIWVKPNLRWLICCISFVTGIIGLVITKKYHKENLILWWCLCVPLIYYSFERLLRFLSLKFYKRDFYLWLKGSDDIDNSLFAKNPHIKELDVIFSIVLLVSIVGLTVTGIIIIKE